MAYIYGYLLRRIGPGGEQLAGEITNATFETAAKRLKAYARGSATIPMRLWLLKLAGDQLVRRRSKLAQTVTFAQPGDNPAMAHMRAAIHKLAPRKQAALSLALIEGLSGDELAAALGMRLPRAMGLLRAALKDVGKYLSAQPFSSEEGD
jgi:DNA-directed RNA polymerase specialized sigma24 family protein